MRSHYNRPMREREMWLVENRKGTRSAASPYVRKTENELLNVQTEIEERVLPGIAGRRAKFFFDAQ